MILNDCNISFTFCRISTEEISWKQHLQTLQEAIEEDSVNYFNINRNNVLDGAVRVIQRKSFKPMARIDVKFSDSYGSSETAVDAGGPTREFFRLLTCAVMHSNIFEGEEAARILSRNDAGL